MAAFIDLQDTEHPNHFSLTLRPEICGGPPDRAFLFGGVGVGAAIIALERACARPVVWATAQFVSFARPPSVVDFEVRVANAGRQTSQASVVARVGDLEFMTVSGALGSRPGPLDQTWAKAPDVRPPAECEIIKRRPEMNQNDVRGQFDLRAAAPSDPDDAKAFVRDGRIPIWARPLDGAPIDKPMLAVMGDFVSQGFRWTIGEGVFGNSLDNTMRFVTDAPTDWVLCDIHLDALSNGVVHGSIRLFSESGVLMAVASQTLILRPPIDKTPAEPAAAGVHPAS